MTAPGRSERKKDGLLLLFIVGLLAAREDEFQRCHAFVGRLGLDDCNRMRRNLARLDNSLKAREEMLK